jgi:hypothetical protein
MQMIDDTPQRDEIASEAAQKLVGSGAFSDLTESSQRGSLPVERMVTIAHPSSRLWGQFGPFLTNATS